MALLQGMAEPAMQTAVSIANRAGDFLVRDDSLLFGWLPSWGAVFQPVGMVLFLVAAQAEIKRAPFDTPEGESEIIGYFLEYSGLKSGMFLIAEYAETVVVGGIVTSIFLGGYHIPWLEPTIVRTAEGWLGASGTAWLAVLQVFAFILKMLSVVWVMFVVRWAFPRFRYDQIMRLGWKMMLPVSLLNVVITGAVFLWAGRDGLAWVGIAEWIAILFFIGLTAGAQPINAEAGSHASTARAHPSAQRSPLRYSSRSARNRSLAPMNCSPTPRFGATCTTQACTLPGTVWPGMSISRSITEPSAGSSVSFMNAPLWLMSVISPWQTGRPFLRMVAVMLMPNLRQTRSVA